MGFFLFVFLSSPAQLCILLPLYLPPIPLTAAGFCIGIWDVIKFNKYMKVREYIRRKLINNRRLNATELCKQRLWVEVSADGRRLCNPRPGFFSCCCRRICFWKFSHSENDLMRPYCRRYHDIILYFLSVRLSHISPSRPLIQGPAGRLLINDYWSSN